MDNEYKPHQLEWTDEKVARFWNFYNNYAPFTGTWFTQKIGAEILKFANRKEPIKGNVLDYGTGQGFLLQQLLDKYPDISLYACDFTDTLAEETGNKFKNNEAFKGCLHITGLPSEYKTNFFDVVFLIETIEHLTDNYLHATLKEIYRILKPGGCMVITTPNNESIEKKYVHCADCGATFHRMQHVRSWNVNTLSQITDQFGFKNVECKALNLKWYKKNGALHYISDKLKKMVSGVEPENLIYIGKK
ncbi:class I SAM-dependent methyltransferase [soil metagenome]